MKPHSSGHKCNKDPKLQKALNKTEKVRPPCLFSLCDTNAVFSKLSFSFSNVLRLSDGSGNLSHLSFHQPWGSATGHCPGILCTASWQVCLALQMSISWQPWSSTSETPTPPCFPAQCLGRPEPCSTPIELPVSQWISFKIHVFVGN